MKKIHILLPLLFIGIMNNNFAQQTPGEIKNKLLEYELILQRDDNGFEQVYRAIGQQIQQQESHPANRAVWHSCMASLLTRYYLNNSYRILDRTPIEGELPNDLNVWDLQTIVKQIVFHYQQSLRDADLLIQIPLKDYAAILDMPPTEPYRPTLYDLLANRALDFLSDRIKEMPIPVTPFDANNGKYWSENEVFTNMLINSPDEYSFSYLSLKIMQTLTRLHLRDAEPYALLDVTLRRYNYLSEKTNLDNAQETLLKELLKLEEHYRGKKGYEMIAYELGEYYQNRADSYNEEQHPEYRTDFITAIEWYKKTLATAPKSIEANNAQIALDNIQARSIQFSVTGTMPANQPNLINFSYKNSDVIRLRVIPMTKDEYSRILSSNTPFPLFIARKHVYETTIPAPNEGDYRTKQGHFLLPPIEKGSYLLLASNGPFDNSNQKEFAFTFVQMTGLAATYRQNANQYDFFVFDRVTGQPISGASVSIKCYDDYRRWHLTSQEKLTTDKEGRCNYTFTNKQGNTYLDVVVSKNGDELTLIQNKRIYTLNDWSSTDRKTYIFTDRNIYRPGQTVYYKGIVMGTRDPGLQSSQMENRVMADVQEEVSFRDANFQILERVTKTTNEYGSFSGSFVLPTTGLTGHFSIDCKHGVKYISVEEYKRPTFEVTMEQPKEQFKIDQEVEVTGNVKAYAGYALEGATVKYKVVREATFPWWRCWWWTPSSPTQQIASGEVVSEADGTFRIRFTALPDLENQRHDPLYNFKISVDVTDITGETHSANSSVRISKKSLLIDADIPQQIATTDKNSFLVRATNLAGEAQKSTLRYTIEALQTPSEYKYGCPRHDYYLSDSATMMKALPYLNLQNDKRPENWKVMKSVCSGTFETDGKNTFAIPNLANFNEGTYKITFITQDKDNNEIREESYITVYQKESKKSVIYKPLWIHQEKGDINEVGQTVHVTVESYLKNAYVLCEIISNNRVIESKWVNLNRGKTSFTYKLTEKDLGNVVFHAFTAQNNNQYDENLTIYVPYSHKDIDFEFITFRDKTMPGSTEQYQIRLKNKNGDKVAAEVLCSMYDASLDAFASPNYFNKNIVQWWNNNLYQYSFNNSCAYFSSNHNTPITKKQPSYLKDREYPRLEFLNDWYSHRYMGRVYKSPRQQEVILNVVEDNLKVSTDIDFVEDEVIIEDAAGIDMETMIVQTYSWSNDGKEAAAAGSSEEPQDQGGIRTNFNETAFFYPDLHTDSNGDVFITFTMPESLTRWKLLGFAHNTDLMTGSFEKYVQTYKKLMVVPNVPRFLREGDMLILSAKVVNMDSVTQCGNVTLTLRNPFNNADLRIVDGENAQPFEVKPGASQEVHFRVRVPENLGAVTCRIEARNLETPAFTDGEERTLPILTNRILITESLPLHISGKGSKSFTFDRLKNSFAATASKTLTTQSLTLEFTPNPIWYAIQAMPYLMEYPHECNEQIFSRYYANTLATNIVNSHPRVKEVFNEWLNATPDAFCSQLEKNQELKSVLLEETPWVLDAQNESARKQNVALLFDLQRMAKEGKNACKKLEDQQNGDGGWSWFAGGQSSTYITEHIVAGVGHLQALHVKSDLKSNTIQKAINFIDKKMNEYYQKWQKQNQTSSWGDIHYLYARSFFLSQKVIAAHQEAYNYNLANIKKNWKKQSIYMQGMIALICHRNGDTQTAKAIIANIKSMAQYSEELGMFWKKAGYGYYWYEAPIERQALLIEAFNTITHDTESVEKMQLWLLKQKQTQSWPTTKSTTEAIYALLLNNDQIENTSGVRLSLGDHWSYTEGDGSMQAEAGTGYIKKSWKGGDVTADMATLRIDKESSGPAWGGLYWQYLENLDKVEHSQDGDFSIQKQLYKVETGERGDVLTHITEDSPLQVGDKVRVRVEIRTDRDMEYVHLKDMRASCFEPVNVLSGYRHQDGLWYYEATKDASTNFFIDYLPKGTYVFEYTLMATMAGTYSNGLTTIQCMYAPEFTSHSEGIRVTVK